MLVSQEVPSSMKVGIQTSKSTCYVMAVALEGGTQVLPTSQPQGLSRWVHTSHATTSKPFQIKCASHTHILIIPLTSVFNIILSSTLTSNRWALQQLVCMYSLFTPCVSCVPVASSFLIPSSGQNFVTSENCARTYWVNFLFLLNTGLSKNSAQGSFFLYSYCLFYTQKDRTKLHIDTNQWVKIISSSKTGNQALRGVVCFSFMHEDTK